MAEKNNPFKSENYKKNIDEKPSGLFSKLFDILKKIFKIDSVKNLPSNSSQVASKTSVEYTKTSSKTIDSDGIKSMKKKNPLYVPYRRDSGYESSLDEGPEYEDISTYQEKMSKNLENKSRDQEQVEEELIYSTISQDHIQAKRKLKQKQEQKQQEKPKPPISPKQLPQVPEKITGAPKVNWATYPGNVEGVINANPPTSQKPFPAPRKSLNSDQRSGTKSTMKENIPPTHKPKEQIYMNTANKSGAANQRSGKPIATASEALPATKMSVKERVTQIESQRKMS